MYKISRSSNREGAVNTYLNANEDWMTEDEQVLATELLETAKKLDALPRGNANLTKEFRMLFMALHHHKPVSNKQIKQEAVVVMDAFDELMKDY